MVKPKDGVLVQGASIQLGEQTFVIPALNFRQLQEHEKDIQAVRDLPPTSTRSAILAAVLPIVLSAMKRNYPDITRDDLEELIDLSNHEAVFDAAMGVTKEMRETIRMNLAAISRGEKQPVTTRVQ